MDASSLPGCYRYNMYIFEYVIVLLKYVRLFLVKPSSGSKCLFKTCTYISGYFIPLGINYCTLPCQVKMAPVQSYKMINRWSMKPLSEVQSKDSLSIYLSVCLCAKVLSHSLFWQLFSLIFSPVFGPNYFMRNDLLFLTYLLLIYDKANKEATCISQKRRITQLRTSQKCFHQTKEFLKSY